MKPFFYLIPLLAACRVCAQNPILITVKAGEDMGDLYQQVYRYPNFQPGKIYFTDDSARSLFNYNLFDTRIEFIGQNNDTLMITNEKAIRQVIIGKDSFYFQDGTCFLLLADYGYTRLFAKDVLKLADEKNMGTYGVSSSTHSIETRRTLLSLQTMTLQLNKDIVFSKERHFFITDGKQYLQANRKNILKHLSKDQKALVEQFISTQQLDLKKQEDLERVLQYVRGNFRI